MLDAPGTGSSPVRLWAFPVVMAGLLAILFCRLFYVQIVRRPEIIRNVGVTALVARPEVHASTPKSDAVSAPSRGNFLDRHFVEVTVCSESGQVATDDCPDPERHFYRRGKEPRERCTLHEGNL